jgi:hypothetical protein
VRVVHDALELVASLHGNVCTFENQNSKFTRPREHHLFQEHTTPNMTTYNTSSIIMTPPFSPQHLTGAYNRRQCHVLSHNDVTESSRTMRKPSSKLFSEPTKPEVPSVLSENDTECPAVHTELPQSSSSDESCDSSRKSNCSSNSKNVSRPIFQKIRSNLDDDDDDDNTFDLKRSTPVYDSEDEDASFFRSAKRRKPCDSSTTVLLSRCDRLGVLGDDDVDVFAAFQSSFCC